ncbi:MAG: RNA signal recognition particle [Alphaproteobacteria bacterium]|nr:MAG: RNA signal recognition particle [Alphaproteobacteria bacterium]
MYVDGFVLAVPKQNLDRYKAAARQAGDVWREYGALSYVECVADDAPYGELTSFPRAVQAKDDEVVVFSWATYADRKSRDEVMAKVMADPRMQYDKDNPVFDGKRMIWGGFDAFIEL